jgi:hypothetical protein
MSKKQEPLKITPMPLDTETKDSRIEKLDKRLFGHPFRLVVVASSGGGKSSFIYSMIKDKKMYGGFFDKILIWNGSPRYNAQYQKIDNTEVFNHFNEEEINNTVNEIREMQEKRKSEGLRYYRILFIFDDYSSKGLVHRNSINVIDDVFCSGRNAGISIIVTAQVYNHINRNCRMTNLTHLIVLGVNKKMIEEIADEHQSELATPEDVIKIYKDVRVKDPYGALIVDYQRNQKERFRTLNSVYKIENGNTELG